MPAALLAIYTLALWELRFGQNLSRCLSKDTREIPLPASPDCGFSGAENAFCGGSMPEKLRRSGLQWASAFKRSEHSEGAFVRALFFCWSGKRPDRAAAGREFDGHDPSN